MLLEIGRDVEDDGEQFSQPVRESSVSRTGTVPTRREATSIPIAYSAMFDVTVQRICIQHYYWIGSYIGICIFNIDICLFFDLPKSPSASLPAGSSNLSSVPILNTTNSNSNTYYYLLI